ncbi:MAG: UDP-2,3-diacylglucosamine hydrolase [Bacteroidia bacterium]|nr:UDP-2,3-diacylglucosamine hydrolase [Bacteroidia bacterium]
METKIPKRKVELAVISDVHLGTYGCHAAELVKYLKSIKPETLVLNGDIIDIWQFSKSYFPKEHMQVIKQITGMIAKGVKVYYVTGNHDEMMRKFVGFELGSFKIVNKIVLNLEAGRAWIFHGDVFDVTMKHTKWVAKLGGHGYDLLIVFNRFINRILEKTGREKISLSKKIKDSVKGAVKHANNFELTAAEIGISNEYNYVVCGHIHKPEIRDIRTEKGNITYLNSGDWVENLTALEYNNNAWSIYHYNDDKLAQNTKHDDEHKEELTTTELYANLLQEFLPLNYHAKKKSPPEPIGKPGKKLFFGLF